jgi:dTMP kinase
VENIWQKIMIKNMRKGILVTFEGGEGAGKTTLIDEMARQLVVKGRAVLKTREPGGTRLGEHIRSILLQHPEPISPYAELSLFLASRAQHIVEVIGPALEQGKIVLCDRFNDSSVAYQGAARGLGMQEVEHFCKFISQGVEPAITFYLDLDPEIGLARAAKERKQDRIEAETLLFHRKIREAYLAIHRKYPHRFHLIDAGLPPQKVCEEAMKRLGSYV